MPTTRGGQFSTQFLLNNVFVLRISSLEIDLTSHLDAQLNVICRHNLVKKLERCTEIKCNKVIICVVKTEVEISITSIADGHFFFFGLSINAFLLKTTYSQ